MSESEAISRRDCIGDPLVDIDRVSISREKPLDTDLILQSGNRNDVDLKTGIDNSLDVDRYRSFGPSLLQDLIGL